MILNFFEYFNDMDDIQKNIHEYNPNKKDKILIVFDNIIADMLSIKKFNIIVTKSFKRSKILNNSVIFATQTNLQIRLCTLLFITTPNKSL